MAARRGYTKLPGTAERYRVASTGEVISRRQYDNRRYVDLGWRSRDDFERRFDEGHSGMAGYRRWREAAIANGVATPNQIDRPGSEFNRLFLKARGDDFDRGGRRRGPRSPIAKLLVYIGLRDASATFPVGGS